MEPKIVLDSQKHAKEKKMLKIMIFFCLDI